MSGFLISRNTKAATAFVLALLCAEPTFAQGPTLFGPKDYIAEREEGTKLGSDEAQKFNRIRHGRSAKATYLVAATTHALEVNPETMSIALPGGKVLVFKRSVVDAVSWVGHSNTGALATFGFSNGTLIGSVYDGSDHYAIRSINSQLHAVTLVREIPID